jgi:hypothetical protein
MLSSVKPLDVTEELIPINILIPGYRLRTISVFPSTSIASLKLSLPHSDLIFNGQILNDAHTIAFYQIQPHASLVAVPDGGEAAKWMKITLDSDTFDDSIRSVVNRSTRNESLRLQDLRSVRIETRTRSFRKFCWGWRKRDLGAKRETGTTRIPGEAEAVSETPLPVCW